MRISTISRTIIAGVIGVLGWTNVAHAGLIGIDFDSGDLYSVSTSNAALSIIGSTGIAGFGSLEFAADGTLYGFTVASTSELYTINPTTANATLVGPLGFDFVFEGGLAIAPDGNAYGTNEGNASNPVLFSINLSTGVATIIGTISGGSHDIDGLTLRSDGMLVGLDRVTNSLLEIDPVTAVSSVIAALSPTVGSVGGVVSDGTTGFFSTAASTGSNELYSFNLFTGAHSLIGSFAPTISGAGISGLAFVPEPTTLALLGAGLAGLAFYRRRRQAA